jgi:transketolase
MDDRYERLLELMGLATGDEKHAASAHSTLDVIWTLYDRVLRVDPADPDWPERDRFVLSKGHGPLAYYAVLAQKGFFPEEELTRFQRYDGILGAHPDRSQVPGVEISSGSLGHGLPIATGMALGLLARGSGGPRVVVLCGDAELNEGSNWEAVMLAGARGLDALTCVVIDNQSSTIPMDGLVERFAAFGWAGDVVDGRDHDLLEKALSVRHQGGHRRPGLVVAQVEATA